MATKHRMRVSRKHPYQCSNNISNVTANQCVNVGTTQNQLQQHRESELGTCACSVNQNAGSARAVNNVNRGNNARAYATESSPYRTPVPQHERYVVVKRVNQHVGVTRAKSFRTRKLEWNANKRTNKATRQARARKNIIARNGTTPHTRTQQCKYTINTATGITECGNGNECCVTATRSDRH